MLPNSYNLIFGYLLCVIMTWVQNSWSSPMMLFPPSSSKYKCVLVQHTNWNVYCSTKVAIMLFVLSGTGLAGFWPISNWPPYSYKWLTITALITSDQIKWLNWQSRNNRSSFATKANFNTLNSKVNVALYQAQLSGDGGAFSKGVNVPLPQMAKVAD